MSQRFKIEENVNASKNTRLPVVEDFLNYRFNRDELAHVSRYLLVCERIVALSKKLGRPLRVLDIGCGDIYIARVLQASFRVKKDEVIEKYVGFDIDDILFDKIKETLPKSFQIKLVCGDITKPDTKVFKDKDFDVVICLETVEHIKPKYVELLLKEIKRLGDYYFISTPNFDGGSGSLPEDHIKEWTYKELKALFKKVGFVVNEEIGTFCNLNKVKQLCKSDKTLDTVFSFLRDKVDGNFLSIMMAKFMKQHSQNLLYICR